MAKQSKTFKVKNPSSFLKSIINRRHIVEYNTENMKIFGVNIIMARFIPGNIDGLKPVERRILYAVYMAKRAKKIKMTKALGETMTYHP